LSYGEFYFLSKEATILAKEFGAFLIEERKGWKIPEK